MKKPRFTVIKMIALASLVIGLAWRLSSISIEKPQEEIQIELPEQITVEELETIDETKYQKELTTENTEATEYNKKSEKNNPTKEEIKDIAASLSHKLCKFYRWSNKLNQVPLV